MCLVKAEKIPIARPAAQKSSYLKSRFPHSLVHDFLKTDLFLEYSKRPSLLRERLPAKNDGDLNYPVILDEVQKIPQMSTKCTG
jgi:hypothetical protein